MILLEGDYKPDIATDSKGTNWFDRELQQIWIVLGGGEPVDIITSAEIVVAFNMPTMTADEFFSPELIVSNMAAFFNIPASKIKIVDAVREKRRKRQNEQTIDVRRAYAREREHEGCDTGGEHGGCDRREEHMGCDKGKKWR